MKQIFTILLAVLITASVFAQSPEKMSYQAVIRDVSDNLITSTNIGMQISILQSSAGGTAVYVERHFPTTNANGLVSLEIGTGTIITGDFTTIDWANDIYFIKTETDLNGGASYTITGTSQLLSVPYALHAKTAENVTGTISETDPIFISSPANSITNTDITTWDNKLDSEIDGSITNEIQILSISNDTIYLTSGGFVKLPVGFDGQYSSLTGVPTNVSTFTNDANYLTTFTEVDGSVTNELQVLSISNDTIYLTNGGFAKLPTGFDGQYGSLSGAPTNVSSFTNDAGYVTSDSLTLSINGNDLSISGGNTVTLPSGGSSGGFQIFSTSGTFTIPEGVNQIIVEVWGAGGGGSAGGTSYGGNGGPGGGYGKEFINVTSGQAYAVTVGTGGNGGSGAYGAGTAGGTTSFGALVSATGGNGGTYNSIVPGGTSSATIFEKGASGGDNPSNCSVVGGGLVAGPKGNWGKGGDSGNCGSTSGLAGQNGYCIVYW